MRMIQPVPYGSWLISSGWPPRSALPATTSPLTGLYTSEAALTDSTTAQASPAATRRPASGASTNTRSPSACWAWSEIPTVTVPSASRRAHSWDLRNRRSAGTLLMVCSVKERCSVTCASEGDGDLAVADERRPHDRGVQQPAADLDLAV